jgi:hypothetical protein
MNDRFSDWIIGAFGGGLGIEFVKMIAAYFGDRRKQAQTDNAAAAELQEQVAAQRLEDSRELVPVLWEKFDEEQKKNEALRKQREIMMKVITDLRHRAEMKQLLVDEFAAGHMTEAEFWARDAHLRVPQEAADESATS